MMADGENLEVIRKKLLLRILARREAKRLGLVASEEEVQEVIDEFRLHKGLITTDEMTKWLGSEEVKLEAFVRAMYDAALICKIEQLYDSDIAREIHNHIWLSGVRGKSTSTSLPS